MNRDFHYFGTYCAAVLAGFDKMEAEEIAWAAQMVDDCTEKFLKEPSLRGQDYIPTCQSDSDILAANGVHSNEATNDVVNKVRHIWMPFHFLPGNLDGHIQYTGNKTTAFDHADFGANGRDTMDFKCLCLHNSPLALGMINDTREKVTAKQVKDQNKLHLIGIRMHVLADTWAHEFFAGTPSYWINNVYANKSCKPLKEYDFSCLGKKDTFTTPAAPSNRSMFYLGHGGVGHLPDYSFMGYEYLPHWKNEKIERRNPEIFISAFEQMVIALMCIKNNKQFDLEPGTRSKTIDKTDYESYRSIIQGILAFKNSSILESKILLPFDNASLPSSPASPEDAWISFILNNEFFATGVLGMKYDAASHESREKMVSFQPMAQLHVNYVGEILKDSGIEGFN